MTFVSVPEWALLCPESVSSIWPQEAEPRGSFSSCFIRNKAETLFASELVPSTEYNSLPKRFRA